MYFAIAAAACATAAGLVAGSDLAGAGAGFAGSEGFAVFTGSAVLAGAGAGFTGSAGFAVFTGSAVFTGAGVEGAGAGFAGSAGFAVFTGSADFTGVDGLAGAEGLAVSVVGAGTSLFMVTTNAGLAAVATLALRASTAGTLASTDRSFWGAAGGSGAFRT